MTEKDRPRKKNWKREYERGRDRERISKDMGPVLYISSQEETIVSAPARAS